MCRKVNFNVSHGESLRSDAAALGLLRAKPRHPTRRHAKSGNVFRRSIRDFKTLLKEKHWIVNLLGWFAYINTPDHAGARSYDTTDSVYSSH